nr:PKD domain-containing protein [Bacteroidota bacterium]
IILMINSNVHAETYHIDGYVILEDLLLPVELQIIEIRDQNGSFITSLITNMDGFYTGEFEIDPAFSPYVSVELWRFCNGEIIFYNHDIMLNNPCLTSTFFVCRDQPCIANFNYTQTALNSLEIEFTDISQGDITSWFWDFGDGEFSTEQNPTHIYELEDHYQVKLTAMGTNCVDEKHRGLFVFYQDCLAKFTYEQTNEGDDLIVRFFDESQGNIDQWFWDFDDGGSSGQQNPEHQFAEPGNYLVNLHINGPGCWNSTWQTVIVMPVPGCFPHFNYEQLHGANLELVFSDLSVADSISTWNWEFGDGNMSNLANPNHIYDSAGYYDVSLEINGPCCNCFFTRNIQVLTSNDCTADFDYQQPSLYEPIVEFQNLSTGEHLEYFWDFGDGTTATETSPVHEFPAFGSYDVTLKNTGFGCTDTIIKDVQVIEMIPCEAIFSFWSASPESTEIHFINESVGLIEEYLWKFGDGTFSNEENPIHNYAQHGDYTVELNIFSSNCADSTNLLVQIAEPAFCDAIFSFWSEALNLPKSILQMSQSD